jgi:prepilin-type N-terminal cleavage/methylation domain-containing protein/prepilin-type processing-associated H-X9-DG protein
MLPRQASGETRHGRSLWREAFTLVELLVVIAVVAILAGLLLPAISRSKSTAQRAKCLNSLRQVGIYVQLQAQDNNGLFQVDAPLEPRSTWGSLLSTNQQVRAPDIFVCPSYAPKLFTNWFKIYGVRQDSPAQNASGEFREYLRVDSVERPTDYLLVADTTSRGRKGIGSEQFYFFRAASEKEVHSRHHARANGWFVDGHVESADRRRLNDLGIEPLVGVDTVPSYF